MLGRMSKLAGFCALSDDGTLWIYEGTFEAMLDVYRALGYEYEEDFNNISFNTIH